jgi:hypothetical protein
VVGVERCAEIRRQYFVERRLTRATSNLLGSHRDTRDQRGVAAAVCACGGGVEARSVPGVDLRTGAGRSRRSSRSGRATSPRSLGMWAAIEL